MATIELSQEYLCSLCEERVRAFDGNSSWLGDHCAECEAELVAQHEGDKAVEALIALECMTTDQIQEVIHDLLKTAATTPRALFYATSGVPWLQDIAPLYA